MVMPLATRRRGKGSNARRRAGPPTHALDLALTSLELARGSDGLFRGEPEPALVVGVYRAHPSGRVALAGRLLARVRPPEGGFPACAPLAGHAVSYDTRFSPDEHVVVVVAGVEEDGGAGVAALYERLADAGGRNDWTLVLRLRIEV